MNCGEEMKPLKGCDDCVIKHSKFTFKDGICFKDEEMYGKIVYADDKLITIEIDNGNEYMKGKIVDFSIYDT